jgi:long-chain fatty acid transport protein
MNTELDGDLSITGLAVPLEPQTEVTFEWDNPQLIEVGIRQPLSDTWTLVANADWEDWSAFADNVLTVSDAPAGPVVAPLDRRWSGTYKIGAGGIYRKGEQRLGFGVSYDSSPVDDEDRTLDLPSDQQLRFGFAWGRDQGDKYDWGLGTTLLWLGNGKIDQENQGVRFAGEFDQNLLFFVGATIRRIF